MKKIIFSLVIIVLLVFFWGLKKTPTPLPNDSVILAFGDSLTYGTGATQGNSYPEQLAELLQVKVIRSGVPGEISETGLQRLKKTLDEHAADILILCHGGNDILQKRDLKQTKNNLTAMIELAQSKGLRVILVGVPKWSGILGVDTAKFYDEIADEMQVEYESNIVATIVNNPNLKSDTVHPNDAGYQKMAEAIKTVITNWLFYPTLLVLFTVKKVT